MTPKEKAEQLLKTFALGGWPKENSLKALDEALNVFIEVHNALQTAGLLKFSVEEAATYKFWQEVKKELEKI
jgi:hypothetical protein